jgi:hypothetical protein
MLPVAPVVAEVPRPPRRKDGTPPPRYDLATAVAEVRALVAETGLRPLQASAEWLASHRLTDEALARCAEIAIARLVGDDLHRDRFATPEDEDGAPAPPAPARTVRSGRTAAWGATLFWAGTWSGVLYEDAEGKMKPLLDFGVPDLEAVARRSRSHAEAHLRIAEAAEGLKALLEAHKVERVRDLPPAAHKEAIAYLAVWR